jgi:rubrerythrin
MKRKNNVYLIKKTHMFSHDEYICSKCGYKAEKRFSVCPGCSSVLNKEKYDANWVDELEYFDIITED